MATLDDVELPDDLVWVDEFTAWAVAQSVTVMLTGALLIQEAAQQAGRPITLQSGVIGGAAHGVVTRAVADALRAKAAVAGGSDMTLVLPDHPSGTRTFTVRWRHAGGAFDAQPIDFQAPAAATDLYTVTLRLMVV